MKEEKAHILKHVDNGDLFLVVKGDSEYELYPISGWKVTLPKNMNICKAVTDEFTLKG